jgi:hypothetical protein
MNTDILDENVPSDTRKEAVWLPIWLAFGTQLKVRFDVLNDAPDGSEIVE